MSFEVQAQEEGIFNQMEGLHEHAFYLLLVQILLHIFILLLSVVVFRLDACHKACVT